MHVALLGRNIEYSKSPQIFEAIFSRVGCTGRFSVCSIEPDELHDRLSQLVSDNFDSFCVTIPYKEEVIHFLDEVDPVAQQLRAVNSVAVKDGRLWGYNTDWLGFSQPLKSRRVQISGGSGLILGYGGAARASIYSLWKDFGLKRFIVAGRSVEAATQMKKLMENSLADIEIELLPIPIDQRKLPDDLAIVVNGTPLGGSNYAEQSPLPDSFEFDSDGIYYDLNYNDNNSVLKAARRAGAVAIDGRAMLVSQALHSWKIWTGQTVGFQPVYEAVFSSEAG